jgi:hypothetical protein
MYCAYPPFSHRHFHIKHGSCLRHILSGLSGLPRSQRTFSAYLYFAQSASATTAFTRESKSSRCSIESFTQITTRSPGALKMVATADSFVNATVSMPAQTNASSPKKKTGFLDLSGGSYLRFAISGFRDADASQSSAIRSTNTNCRAGLHWTPPSF